MALASTVQVKCEPPPRFPDRCVLCNQSCDAERIQLAGNPAGRFGGFLWIGGLSGRLTVPAHTACGLKLRRSLRWRNLGMVTATLAAVALAFAIGLAGWSFKLLAIGPACSLAGIFTARSGVHEKARTFSPLLS